ncbi:MAG: NTP transferase domain-containing protein [Alphaproteobacteria bacterium]
MKFGRIPAREAAGALLAHSVKLPAGGFKKGRALTDDDVAKLVDAGIATVVAARLDPDDVLEDDAATVVAEAVCGEGVSMTAAFTGRANLVAETAGVVVLDRARLDRLNLVDECVTVGTLPPYAVVAPKQMVATVKIIPFAVPRATVDACAAIGREAGALLRVAPFRPKRAALVQTLLPGMKARIFDKTAEITRARIEALGGELVAELRCGHDEVEVAERLAEAQAAGAEIFLIAGASAIVDRRDVVPTGIELAGGRVVHFGMPVDPGNLILMGDWEGAPVVGLPGCARSPKLNGFDWVLQRLVADLPVGPREIMLMGPGGLLTDVPTRPLPRAEAIAEEAPREPRITAVILAAGLSRRMGAANKLLADVDGMPMLARVVDSVIASKAKPILVVTGHEAEAVRAALGDRPVTFVHNPAFAEGLAGSVKAGIDAVPPNADGAVVCLGDMPRIGAALIDRMIAAFDPGKGALIVVPTAQGKRGNPVLWARRFFDEIMALAGDRGAKALIEEHGDQVAEVAMPDPGVALDIDTPEALAAFTGAKA